MFRYRTEDETRRYDLMKLGVLLLLLALLALTWVATRDPEGGEAITDQPAPTLPATTAAPTGTFPAAPSVDVPATSQLPGSVTISGMAAPGSQIVILVNGQPAGAATAGVDGAWSSTIELPAGEYTVQARTVDNVGAVIGESSPVTVTVGEATPAAESTSPRFDSLSGTYTFEGTATPGDTITLTNNGAAVGTTTADEAGNWSITVPAEGVTGDVQVQATDAAGNVTQQSQPIKLGPPPPVLAPSETLVVDPETGAVALPSQPGGLTLSGRGEPGTQVELLVDDVRGGLAVVDAAGAWSMPLAPADGVYTLQLNTLDPGGNLLAAGQAFTATVGTAVSAAPTPGSGETQPPAEATAAPTEQTIAELLAGRAEFSTLLSVIETAGMVEGLAVPGALTVFAPTNDAFALLPQQVIDQLRANPQALATILQYHVALGRYTAADLLVVQPATLNGLLLTVTPQDNTLLINDALVTEPDLPASNGIVHAIDRILVPPLEPGVRPVVIDDSGVSTFFGSQLTVTGTAEPGNTVMVTLNGESFGQPAIVDPNTQWAVSGEVTPGDYRIVAYMLDGAGVLRSVSRPVTLQVK